MCKGNPINPSCSSCPSWCSHATEEADGCRFIDAHWESDREDWPTSESGKQYCVLNGIPNFNDLVEDLLTDSKNRYVCDADELASLLRQYGLEAPVCGDNPVTEVAGAVRARFGFGTRRQMNDWRNPERARASSRRTSRRYYEKKRAENQ